MAGKTEVPAWVGKFDLGTDDGCLAVLEGSLRDFMQDRMPQKKLEAVVDVVRLAQQIGMGKHRKQPKVQPGAFIPSSVTPEGPFRRPGAGYGDA